MHNGTMSVPWLGSMRGSRLRRTLLLFLLLLSAGTVLCQADGNDEAAEAVPDEDTSAADPAEGDASTSEPLPDDPETPLALEPPPTDEETLVDNTAMDNSELGSGVIEGSGGGETDPKIVSEEEQSVSPTIILIAVGLGILIIAVIVAGIVISRRCNTKAKKRGLKEEDPYLDGSAGEKVPMPMFEEDVPSVLELEMEELDQWMQQDDEAAKESTQT